MEIKQIILLSICAGAFIVMGLLVHYGNNYSLNKIKNKTVGDGQHGTAKFADGNEINKAYKRIDYNPEAWRKGKNRPEIQGL